MLLGRSPLLRVDERNRRGAPANPAARHLHVQLVSGRGEARWDPDVADVLLQTRRPDRVGDVAHLLAVLLDWHRQDPPDARECVRNAAVYQAQGNRNPFIDHPEWVDRLYGTSSRDARRAWINEFHYDNAGSDQNEMVEIAGPIGLDLAG